MPPSLRRTQLDQEQKEQQRDPEMHQTKKGNQWHFGMKAHIGADAKSGLTTARSPPRPTSMTSISRVILLHGEEPFVSMPMPATKERHSEELAEVDVDWLIAERPGKVKP